MKTFNPKYRKLVYLIIIPFLIILISFVGRPGASDSGNKSGIKGGQLSIMRDQYNLSQSKLSDIDPASETMRLASLGLRGLATSILWMQAMEQKKTENYDQLASTLKTLTKIQPNFVKVWDYQAHNLSYNVSMEFDDFEYRYHWVKKGILFLKEGVPYNKTDHRITDSLGFFTGNKIGKSDEKDAFRRMFGLDTEFHREMSDRVNPDSYKTNFGHNYDNWLMAYQWYDFSRKIVLVGTEAEGQAKQRNWQYSSDMIFYGRRPSARRSLGLSLQNEFRPDESQQEVWQKSQEEWTDYGNVEMRNSLGVEYTMEGAFKADRDLQKLRSELDEIVPGMRSEEYENKAKEYNMSEEMLQAWKTPLEERTDEQINLARKIDNEIAELDADLDQRIAKKAPTDKEFRALEILNQIEKIKFQRATILKDSGTINYAFWKWRTAAESTDLGISARQSLFEAEKSRIQAIHEDEVEKDYRTKTTTVTRLGTLSRYYETFEKFREIFKEHPDLQVGPYGDEVVDEIKKYQEVLSLTGREWPNDFPLQVFLDHRALNGEMDGFPLSIDVKKEKPSTVDPSIPKLDIKKVMEKYKQK